MSPEARFTRTYHKPGVGDRPMQLRSAATKYRMLVEDNARQNGNDPENVTPPMLWLAGPDDLVVMLCTMSPDGDPVIQLQVIAYGISTEVLPRPEWVAYFSETWLTDINQDIQKLRLERGELHDRWKIGMGGVGEAIVGQMIHRDGRGWSVSQLFDRVSPPVAINWQQATEGEFAPEGNVPLWLQIMVGRREWDHADDPPSQETR